MANMMSNERITPLSYTKPSIVKTLYQMAGDLDQLFTEHQINYWTDGGTTLGCVRHKGLIPWDDDIDLCISKNDEQKVLALKPVLETRGYDIVNYKKPFGYRIYPVANSLPLPPGKVGRFPFCDIFLMVKEDGKYVPCHEKPRKRWPNEYYLEDEVENLKRRPYGDLFLNCPGNAEDYLARFYGGNWYSEGVTPVMDHHLDIHFEPVKFQLQHEHYQPAKPFS
ncbi:predicted protein [Nematostella vectensis]|uniref:LicD/FKTN/FKRP nucleotidyltransferase domain-containing protein n=1 Tax=Nematostella vectensis TaxID=45351 RepID=A7RRL8_NEMVE|nr:uncharacterized protein RP689 [Nematostella vectensis]EDO45781.1 predicted protein [Nematostella vectensis]|eukprot:XP_001637844.1 predicted protein [Nematostella vectensis]